MHSISGVQEHQDNKMDSQKIEATRERHLARVEGKAGLELTYASS